MKSNIYIIFPKGACFDMNFGFLFLMISCNCNTLYIWVRLQKKGFALPYREWSLTAAVSLGSAWLHKDLSCGAYSVFWDLLQHPSTLMWCCLSLISCLPYQGFACVPRYCRALHLTLHQPDLVSSPNQLDPGLCFCIPKSSAQVFTVAVDGGGP